MIRRISFVALTLSTSLWARGEMSLEEYLKEVRTKNEAVAGELLAAEGANQKSKEGQMATSTLLFSELEYGVDGRLPEMPFMTYDSIARAKLNLGLKKTFSFGLDAKLYFATSHVKYNGLGGAFASTPINFFDTRPTLELSQQLWGNGFGRSVRAKQDGAEAGDLAKSFASRYTAKSMLSAAEEVYWGLSLARERTEVAKGSLEQAKKIYEWNAERVRRSLADDVDALQAKAALEVGELEMQSAEDAERMVARQFNKMRSVASDEVPKELPDLETETLLQRPVPEYKPQRDDVKAAEQQQRAAIAQATVAREGFRPSLEVYGLAGLNGRDTAYGGALGNPFTANRPAYTVGMRFSMPLNDTVASDAMGGLRKEQISAEMIYRQKQNDMMNDWQDLGRRISELKHRLKLSHKISIAQKNKLQKERARLTAGRTTTFQVLSFEQDYARARLAEINAKQELIRALSQLKLYGGNS